MSLSVRQLFSRRRLVEAAFLGLVVFVWSEGRADSSARTPARGGRLARMGLRESARELGISFRHRPTRLDPALANLEPMIAAVGAAVSICDANGDDWPDLYASTSAHGYANALYVNRGDGTFEDRAAEAGLADVNAEGRGCTMGSVWADWNNDGRQDVFLYKWGHCQLFENLGGLRFRDVTAGSGLEDWVNSHGATWLDYDGDGLLDLFVTGYFPEEHDLWNVKTTKVLQDSFEFARNGGRNRLYRNLGGGRFEDATDTLGVDNHRWTYAVSAADFNGDGWIDLYLANDYGAEELLLNTQGTGFRLADGVGLESESKSGMCVALGNVENDGRFGVFVTNISSPGYLFQGNNLRVNRVPDGRGMEQRASGPVADCGWAWGAQFGDLDDDGWQDLFVTNGFVSARRDRDYWYQMTKVAGATGDLVADVANWPAMEDRSLSGYERSRVLMHIGNRSGRYYEVGRQLGVDDVYDGRAVALGDLDRDGDLDIVVANQNGPLLVYRNDNEAGNHRVEFELTGTESNRDALGAEVRVTSSVGEQVQVVVASSGFSSQNEKRLHFGLGPTPGDVSVRIRWPSGRELVLASPELDVVHRLVESAP